MQRIDRVTTHFPIGILLAMLSKWLNTKIIYLSFPLLLLLSLSYVFYFLSLAGGPIASSIVGFAKVIRHNASTAFQNISISSFSHPLIVCPFFVTRPPNSLNKDFSPNFCARKSMRTFSKKVRVFVAFSFYSCRCYVNTVFSTTIYVLV